MIESEAERFVDDLSDVMERETKSRCNGISDLWNWIGSLIEEKPPMSSRSRRRDSIETLDETNSMINRIQSRLNKY